MDFFDDETRHAPTDAEAPPPVRSSRRRSAGDRRRTRIQRLVILAVILFAAVLGIALWARSCQHSRKVGTYRTYFDGVTTAIADSDKLGKQVARIMENPAKLSRKELLDKLEQLRAKQDEIAVRAAALETPRGLEDEHAVFATGMKVRANGFALLRTTMTEALKNKKVGVKDIVALNGYFSGPDAYYQELAYLPARETLAAEGVADVAVPTSTFFLTWRALDTATVTLALESIGKSAKLSGIHGVALIDVTAQGSTGDLKLVRGKTNEVPASPDLSFVVEVQNQGSVVEKNVPVVAKLILPGGAGDSISQQAVIAVIEAGKTQGITITGFAIPTEALSKEIRLSVTAGPVPGERVETNNSATYKLLLQLQ